MCIDLNTLATLVTALAAVCAIGLTIWQGQQNYKHNQLMVRPILTVKIRYGDKGDSVAFQLINSGVGPAIIKDFVLLFKDKEVSRNNWKDYDEFIKRKTEELEFQNVRTGKYASGAAMQVGEELQLLSFEYDAKKHDIRFINDLDLLVNYQSVYQNETFTYDSRKDRKSHGR